MGNPLIEFGILIVLLILNGFFSGSELGVVSARKSRLQAQAFSGHRGAQQALRLAERPGAFLATVQIGITLIGTISAVFAGGSLTRYLEAGLRPLLGDAADTAASVGVILLVTFLSLVLGELAPKTIALRNPEGRAVLRGALRDRAARRVAPGNHHPPAAAPAGHPWGRERTDHRGGRQGARLAGRREWRSGAGGQ